MELLLSIKDFHKFIPGDCLLLIEELRQLMELLLVISQNCFRLLMLLFYKLNDLIVNLCLKLCRECQ